MSLQLEMEGKQQIPQAVFKRIPSSFCFDSLNNYCEKQLPTHPPRLNTESCNTESGLYRHLREEHKRRGVTKLLLFAHIQSQFNCYENMYTHTHYITNLQLVLHTFRKKKLLNSELAE